MKIKNKFYVVIFFLAVFFILNAGCGKRATPFDPYLAADCGKMGYYSSNYTHKYDGGFLYSAYAVLEQDKKITSISINVASSNEARVAIYSTGGTLLVSSAAKSVNEGWNTIDIPDTLLAADTYRLAVVTRYDSGIRLELGAGTFYWHSNSWPNIPSSIGGGTAMAYAMLIYGNYCE